MLLREMCLETKIKIKMQKHKIYRVSYSCTVLEISGLGEKTVLKIVTNNN